MTLWAVDSRKKEGEVETWVSADGVLLQIEKVELLKPPDYSIT